MSDDLELTALIHRWQSGDALALDELMPAIYAQLRQIAARCMSDGPSRQTLQATAVVNELYLKLANQSIQIESRSQFFALCARVIRNLLTDYARGKHREKRWGNLTRVTLGDDQSPAVDTDELLALDSALDRLQKIDPDQQQYLMLHYFAGLSYDEIADVSAVSRAQVGRELRMAKAWLAMQLKA